MPKLRRLSFEGLELRRLMAVLSPTMDFSPEHSQPTDLTHLVAPLMTAEGEGADERYVGGHHDPYLPNFGHPLNVGNKAVVHSVANGTWSQAVPGATADNVVLIEHQVTIQGDITANTIVIQPGGSLTFSRAANTQLRVVTLQVLEGGRLDMGTAAVPINNVRATIIFRDVPIDTRIDPAQYGNGLIVDGEISIYGKELAQTFTNGATEFRQGASNLSVTGNLSGWSAGDRVYIPDSRQAAYDQPASNSAAEIRDVASVSGSSVNLTTSLRADHLGARNVDGSLVFTPHAANLTRTVLLTSENPLGVRGHFIALHHANVDIQYAEFRDLGRTANADLDSTVFDPAGNVVTLGTNQVGRYPIHIHHVVGPMGGQANGKQFTLVGNAIYSLVKATKWAIAIHDAHYGEVSKNVIYNVLGAGIATEDGSESYNVISNNFISRVGGTGDRGKFTDGREGAGIWLRRPNNYVDNNVVTGAVKAAYLFYGGDNTPAPLVPIPKFPGAHDDADFSFVEAETMALQSFNGNMAYASYIGLELWYMGFRTYYDPTDQPLPETVVNDLSLWHINAMPIFVPHGNQFTFVNTQIYGDPAQFSAYNYQRGIVLEVAVRFKFLDLILQNYRIGIDGPIRTEKLDPTMPLAAVVPFTIDGGRLANVQNIVVTHAGTDAFQNVSPRSILIKNVDFARTSLGVSEANIDMKYAPGRFTNLVQKDVVQVVNYDLTGGNYRVYYTQQAPDYIVPQTGSLPDAGPGSPLGSPVAGLTNAQNWQRFGIAIGGEVAPGDRSSPNALSIAGIRGLVFPGSLSNIVLDAIAPDTGIARDLITSARNIVLSGDAGPGSRLAITRTGVLVGTAVADAFGRWSFDYRTQTLPNGDHVFAVQELDASGNRFGPISSRTVSVRTNAPSLQWTLNGIFADSPSEQLAARLIVNDLDTGDTHRFRINSNNQFTISASGEIRVVAGATLVPGATYSLSVQVEDSAGLSATTTIAIPVLRRPPGFWITQLNYTQFSQLTAADVPFLTLAQVASIPNAYWLGTISATARVAMTSSQIAALTNLQTGGMIGLLTPTQRLSLTPGQVQTLTYLDFPFLPATKIPFLSGNQAASIPDFYWLQQIPASARSAMIATQVTRLPLRAEGMISLLTPAQRALITTSQVQSMLYLDFEYLNASQIRQLTGTQVASIRDSYWFYRIPSGVRAAMTETQVRQIQVRSLGMIALLTSPQRGMLSQAQLDVMRFEEFWLLPTSQILKLSDAQLRTIPDAYWFFLMSAESRNALALAGVRWVSGVGIVIRR